VQVVAQLRGDCALPWEEEELTESQAERLDTLKEPILAMLHRNASQRITMQQFISALCNRG
jgi:hypothetical protein